MQNLALGCTFHVVCVSFICVRWPTQTQFSVEYGFKTGDSTKYTYSKSSGVSVHGVILVQCHLLPGIATVSPGQPELDVTFTNSSLTHYS